eukprot:6566654-Lingulodinium_polyedra.AAC.1
MDSAQQRLREASDRVEELRSFVEERQERLEQKHAINSQKLLLSNCKISDRTFDRLAQLWGQSAYGGTEVDRSMEKLLKAPAEPSELAQAVLSSVTVHLPGIEADNDMEPTDWLRDICWRRSHCTAATLVWHFDTDTEVAYVVVYALQNPFKLMAMEAKRSKDRVALLFDLTPEQILNRPMFVLGDTEFVLPKTPAYVNLRNMALAGEPVVFYRGHYNCDGNLVYQEEPLSLEDFRSIHPMEEPKQRK